MNWVTDINDVKTLVKMTAESLELPCKNVFLSADFIRIWSLWEAAVRASLFEWAKAHVRPQPELWAARVFEQGEAPLNVWFTLTGEGVGTWDGRWDVFFQGNERYLADLERTFKRELAPWIDRMEGALSDAAYECSVRADWKVN